MTYTAERTITAIFTTEERVKTAIHRLMDRGVDREHLSVMGRNFQSETRISGFITKKDVILGGLRTGAVFGSLFGSILSLFTGIGVLFIPFVGSVVAAGPISSILLGAATGAIAGGAGAGLVSFLTTLGMPKDKATLYQTRLQAGEYVLMAEVPAAKSGEYQLLIEQVGGDEIHIAEQALPRPCPGRCESPEDLSPEIRTHLSEDAQQVFIKTYNQQLDATGREIEAEQAAWQTIHDQFEEDDAGRWTTRKREAVTA